MAIEKWKNKDGTTSYVARVRDPYGKWYPSPSFKSLADAKREEARLIEARTKVNAVAAADGRSVTYDQFWEVWSVENRGEVSKGWQISQNQMNRDYVSPVLGRMKMASIKKPDIGKVLNDAKDKGVGDQTRKHIYSLMRKLFNDAVEYYEMIPVSPVSPKFHRPKVKQTERPFLLPAQAFRLMEEARKSYLGPAVWLQLLAGMRACEVQALLWKSVQFEQDRILICSAFNNKTKELQDFPKQEDWGDAPIIPYLREYLLELSQGKDTDDFVAPGPNGGMLSYTTYCKSLPLLIQRMGYGWITTHELRHSCTEIWVQAGANQEDIRRLLNHGSLSATVRYMHRTDARLTALGKGIGPGQLLSIGSVDKNVQKRVQNLDESGVCHEVG